MNLEHELMEKMSKELAQEIDFGILSDLLVYFGWVKIELDTLEHNNNAIDISEWLVINCKHKVNRLGRQFVFESSAEAEWFILRWL
jgi:hypothetical protein